MASKMADPSADPQAKQDKFSSVSKRVLDIYSLVNVLEACQDCAVNWNPIGLRLGLSHPLLEQIAATTGVPAERLQRVLVAWLQKDTLPNSPDPSYYTLCHVIATGGGNPALAERIAETYPASDDKVYDPAFVATVQSSSEKVASKFQTPGVSKQVNLKKRKRGSKVSSAVKARKIHVEEPDVHVPVCQDDTPMESDECDTSIEQNLSKKDDDQYQQDDNKPNESDIFSDPHLQQLAIALQVYSCDLSESGLDIQATLNHIKARIETHIRKKLEDGLSKDDVMKHLTDLTMNALIPMDINDWCYNKLDEIFEELDDKKAGYKDDSSSEENSFCDLPPLFSKDTVYHASLCGLVLSNDKNESVHEYLSRFGHSFVEFSLSVSGSTKIFIAKQQDVMFISFRNSNVESVLKTKSSRRRYSMEEIVSKEGDELPLRYFCELLYQNKRLIFTGFSTGGFLARSIISKIWNMPYFSSKILTQNVACITFGLPCISLTIMEPTIQQSCYSFVLEDDFSQQSVSLGEFMHYRIRNNEEEYIRLPSVSVETFVDNWLSNGSTYVIQQKDDGLHCKILRSENLKHAANTLETSKEKFTMEIYHQRVLRGYLDKEPECYSIPPRQKSQSMAGVQSVIPSISKIELHQHKHPGGNELAIVINGDNLWFCHSIEIAIDQIEVLNFRISPQSVTQKQICYNHMLETEVSVPKQNDLPVKVCSKFAAPIVAVVPVTYNEPDPISFRQSQLAKQTPSQIISLSFLSALLEQSPTIQSGRPTKRFNNIIKFLQEAASIVPMESIVFSIASTTSHFTANKLAQAVISEAHATSIPVSKLMAVGCEEAANTMPFRIRFRSRFRYAQKADQASGFYDASEVSDSRYLPNMYHHSTYPHHEPFGQYHSSALPENCIMSGQSVRLIGPREDCSFRDVYNAVKAAANELKARNSLSLICGRNIGEIYPISKAVTRTTDVSALTPLPQVLQKARRSLTALSIRHKDAKLGVAAVNCNMLQVVNKIIEEDLNPCVTMLGGFMEQQIRVPLVNSNVLDTAKALSTADSSGAIGVWALFALSEKDIESIVSSKRNQTLVIQVANFIEGALKEDVRRRRARRAESTTSYDAKLQFLMQAIKTTVTCSSNYISYSLERELVTICKERKIFTSTSINDIVHNWTIRFQATALALVPRLYRPLLARWLIWALNIHQLREGLASYTTVGVIGLVNSGKSTLVNKVFQIKTIQGTTQSARTTVPFIYNLDSSVEGLSVIDFPGVDDRDESIAGLAKLLVGLAQMIIFVCGYEKFHTGSASEWMEIFKNDFASTPILVCLTQADRLYENNCDNSMIPECPKDKIPALKMQFEDELEEIVGTTEKAHNCMVKFCSLTQSRHSPLNNDKGRQSMRKAGIFTPEDIGEWIKRTLTRNIQQQDLADKFDSFLKST